ncbi:MAG: hypothetical protein WA996_18735, partial [Candidatus Promineifilaceae bacterium]
WPDFCLSFLHDTSHQRPATSDQRPTTNDQSPANFLSAKPTPVGTTPVGPSHADFLSAKPTPVGTTPVGKDRKRGSWMFSGASCFKRIY